jgi:hypothetical protein
MRLEMAAALICYAIAPTSHAGDSVKYPLRLTFVETNSTTTPSTSTQTNTNCTPVPGTEQVNCNSRQIRGGSHTSLTSTVEASDGNTYEVMCVPGAGGRFLAGASQGMAAQSGAPTRNGCQMQPGTYQARWDKGRLKVLLHNSKGKEKEVTFAVLSSHSSAAVQQSAGAKAAAPTASSQIASEIKTADNDGTVFFSAQRLTQQCDLSDHEKAHIDDEGASIVEIHCMGFIAGVADMLSVLKYRSLNPYRACVPDGVTEGQLEKIFKKYADDHPEQLHLSAADVVSTAIATAFPCQQ